MKNFRIKSVFYSLLLVFGLTTCNEDFDPKKIYEGKEIVNINGSSIIVQVGESSAITLTFSNKETVKNRIFTWSIDDPDIASIVKVNDSVASVTGIQPGTAMILVESDDGKVSDRKYLNVTRVYELTHPVLIDFGEADIGPEPWNVFTNRERNANISLYDVQGVYTEYSISNNTSFLSLAVNNPNSFGIPWQVSNDSFFNDGRYGDPPVGESGFTIHNLKKSQFYDFYIYASLDGSVVETEYTISGKNSETIALDNSFNTNRIAIIKNIAPDDNAQVIITMRMGPRNDFWSGYYGINAMALTPAGYDVGDPPFFGGPF